MRTTRVSIRCITDKLASHSKIVVCSLSALCGKKSWRIILKRRSPRKCATLTATCQSAGRSLRAIFSSGIFLYHSRHVLSDCWNFSKLQERCPPLDVFLAEGNMFKMHSFQSDAPRG